jgi:hypothetical protein
MLRVCDLIVLSDMYSSAPISRCVGSLASGCGTLNLPSLGVAAPVEHDAPCHRHLSTGQYLRWSAAGPPASSTPAIIQYSLSRLLHHPAGAVQTPRDGIPVAALTIQERQQTDRKQRDRREELPP